MTDPADDRELFRLAITEGDEAAWRTLYRRHTPTLYRLARHLAESATDADDLVHEMWLRANRNGGRFEERSRLRTWLTGILINCVREWRHASIHRAEAPLDEDLACATDDPPAGLARIDLERGVAALAPGYREVLLLHDLEGYTHQEIADLLAIQVGTSKSQLTRARRALARVLGAGGEETRHA